MKDIDILVDMLKRAGASFDVDENSVTIYGWRDNIISFDFDDNGMVIKAE